MKVKILLVLAVLFIGLCAYPLIQNARTPDVPANPGDVSVTTPVETPASIQNESELKPASAPLEFTADMTFTNANDIDRGKYYVKGDNWREEQKGMYGTEIEIYNAAKKASWTVKVEDGVYYETIPCIMPKPDMIKKDSHQIVGSVKKYLGMERVNGYLCYKYETRPIKKEERPCFSATWVSPKYQCVIKHESYGWVREQNGKWKPYVQIREYKNIKEAELSDSLFLLPKGYKRSYRIGEKNPTPKLSKEVLQRVAKEIKNQENSHNEAYKSIPKEMLDAKKHTSNSTKSPIFTEQHAKAEFSADMVRTTKWSDNATPAGMPANQKAPKMHSFKMKPFSKKSRLYIKGSSARQEETNDGYTMLIINRKDKGVTWIINPNTKQYYEYKSSNMIWDFSGVSRFSTGKKMGIAIVNGHLCDKIQYANRNGNKIVNTCTAYVSQKLGYPIKVQTSRNNGFMTETVECKNIKVTKLADSLFQLPKGAKKVDKLEFNGEHSGISFGGPANFKPFPHHNMPKPGAMPPSKNK